ncbi:MAG: NAD+ synthase [Candidatus Firestonebacteria bacterium RIFOXYC2_FULL_39_67]|nr:MAG: NAD+ synthase [Candidatus Firestonebacteria bacterium RIFOXYD2_FULL_39_29]OGF54001.1 MAG: NAD+ synthase [Candidatus Firestonebacteria bacterium RIFOXYC2_FULL_39_67]OGF57162.1 MAG: NAD+ synthase [Candidatus Firestonebacteria bacterium RifOxyC12_full_39_7]
MRIAACQINTTVGDFAGNAAKIKEFIERSKAVKADIAIFPELTIPGYPPEDLLLKQKFIKDNIDTLKEISSFVKGISAVIGFVDKVGKELYNAAAVVTDGKVTGIYHKMNLPNYGVFDEKRYFKQGEKPFIADIKGVNIGLNICEDIWLEDGPVKTEASDGAEVIITINASPYHAGKVLEREKIIQKRAKDNGVYIVYANMVGGQDELVFDGYSMAVDKNGRILTHADGFKEELLIIDIPLGVKEEKPEVPEKISKILPLAEEVYTALTVGTRDYILKTGFKKVVIGLSGGIDSAIVAAIARDALGKENVTGVFMPTRFSSKESKEDAEDLAKNLGINFKIIPIEDIFKLYLDLLTPFFEGKKPDTTEENLQARIRGNIMMALSNKFNRIVLTTGNKSEMSTGYATLYGDMAGGFAVIKDVPKMLVYEISRYRNKISPVIPENVLIKAPTAELRDNQKDSDSLPEYSELDPILKLYIEEDLDCKQISGKGFKPETVAKVARLVDLSEYKRRQSPPGIKITPKAFGRDRRMPISNKYRG